MFQDPAKLAAAILAQAPPDAGGLLYEVAKQSGPFGIASLLLLLLLVAGVRYVIRPLANEFIRFERVRIEHTAKEIERVSAAMAQTSTLERIALIQERTTAKLIAHTPAQEAL